MRVMNSFINVMEFLGVLDKSVLRRQQVTANDSHRMLQQKIGTLTISPSSELLLVCSPREGRIFGGAPETSAAHGIPRRSA